MNGLMMLREADMLITDTLEFRMQQVVRKRPVSIRVTDKKRTTGEDLD